MSVPVRELKALVSVIAMVVFLFIASLLCEPARFGFAIVGLIMAISGVMPFAFYDAQEFDTGLPTTFVLIALIGVLILSWGLVGCIT